MELVEAGREADVLKYIEMSDEQRDRNPLRRFKTLLVVDLEATCWAEGSGPDCDHHKNWILARHVRPAS